MAHELLAKSDHQLGMCLRMLYAEGIRSSIPVHSAKNEKGKMELLVTVPVDDAQFEVLERRYQTLIRFVFFPLLCRVPLGVVY